jgi:hypothetical protein
MILQTLGLYIIERLREIIINNYVMIWKETFIALSLGTATEPIMTNVFKAGRFENVYLNPFNSVVCKTHHSPLQRDNLVNKSRNIWTFANI